MGLGTTITTPAYDHDRVVAVVTEHAASLLRIARVHSLCPDDAQDAYQRALEIYLQRYGEVDHARAGSWLRTVCKHEAMRIREQRGRLLGAEEVAWDAQPSVDAVDPGEHASSLERVARAAEALQGCKRDEATAMLLKADGSSYDEIGALTGWSRTKVNRALTEGRARFLRRYADIDSGAACATWTPVLSAIVDGEAAPEDLARLRPHLRHCAGCRMTLKALYEAEPALGSLVPAGAFAVAVSGIGDRLVRLHALVEAVTSTKAAAVLASTAAVAAGGAAAADQVRQAPARPEPVVAHVRPPEVREATPRAAAVRRNVRVAGERTRHLGERPGPSGDARPDGASPL